MAFAIDTYTGNNSTTSFSVTFPYIEQAHVIVTIDGVTKTLTTDYTFTNASTITFTSPPATSAVIKFTRSSNRATRLVDYQDGSTLTEATLDQDGNQSFFMAQEGIDITENNISLSNTTDQWDALNKRITNVADPVNNNDAVNKQFISTNLPNITTVAGISSDVTTVAGISSNVTSVAGNATNINTVATNIANVNTVAADIAKVIVVANDLNETVSEIETAAADLQETTSEIDTVATNIANVNTVGNNIANVNTVAGINANVTTVAGNNANITTVAGISSDVTSVAGISSAVSAVNSNATNINTVSGNNANISTVAGISSDVTSVAGIASDVSAVENIKANVTTVAGISTNVTTTATNNANITTVAGSITNVNNVGGSIANVNSVASNLSGVNSFAERYRILSSAPSTSNDVGDLYFDTTANELKVYKSSGWAAAGSTVNGTANRFEYTATANQTTFTGSDSNGATMAYDAGFIDVYLNGVKLANADFTATTGTSVVLASGASVNDILMVVAYGTFQLANESVNDLTDTPAALGTAGQTLVVNAGATALEYTTLQASELTTEGNVFSNYNTISSNITTTLSSTKNSFLKGLITVANNVTWTIAGNGTLEII